jgi:hypothetical protein
MRNTIDLIGNGGLEARYQELLRDECPSLLENSLLLIDEQLQVSGVTSMVSLKANESRKEGAHSHEIPIVLTAELLPFLEKLHTREMPPVPESLLLKDAEKKRPLVEIAFKTAFCLTLQSRFDLLGDAGFFRDVQSLVFTGAIYELLPSLKSSRAKGLYGLLVNVLAYHCTFIWRDDVAHQQYLLGLLAEYLNDEKLERESLLASFHLTDADDHDYLTKAQVCVFHFLKHRRYDAAKSFLMGVLRQARSESLDELREMLDEVYAEEASGNGKSRRKAGV